MSDDRFSQYTRRARTCFRGAASIDSARDALRAAETAMVEEVGPVPMGLLGEARVELANAETHLNRAREKLQAALKEKTPTAGNREVEFWKAGT